MELLGFVESLLARELPGWRLSLATSGKGFSPVIQHFYYLLCSLRHAQQSDDLSPLESSDERAFDSRVSH